LYSKPLDTFIQNICIEKFADFLSERFRLPKEKREDRPDIFRLIYHYCVEKTPSHLPKMQNYVALYGFTRTIALVFNILTWIILFQGILSHQPIINVIGLSFTFSMITFILYIDFNKFYRKFSLEAIMAMTANYPK
jgi:hypothetical protein